VTIDRPVTFYTIAEAARRRGEVAIGYRRAARNDASGCKLGGVAVNPVKSEAPRYEPADRVIVLARDWRPMRTSNECATIRVADADPSENLAALPFM
jgi:hypothetical protein